jgi:TRAP transporter TAXI family solute receptor
MRRTTPWILVLAITTSLALPAMAKKRVFVTIGTGGVTGVYYPVGGAISKIINKKRKEYGIRSSVESTGGSVYNINAVMTGDLEFGIAQSDRQYQAWHGEADWDGKPQAGLRSVFSLHPEIVTLVAADDSGIQAIDGLKGKRVNIGNPGSGHRGNALDIFRTLGLDPEKDFHAEALKAAEAPKMVQDGRIDAFFYTVGHPNGAIQEATSGKRKVHFVPITGVDALIEKYPYYAKTVIPVEDGLYPMASNKKNVESVGVVTTFVTSENVDAGVVYAIVKEVFGQIDQFKKLHPALAHLTRENMLNGLTAPLHDGARRYYIEAGLIPSP